MSLLNWRKFKADHAQGVKHHMDAQIPGYRAAVDVEFCILAVRCDQCEARVETKVEQHLVDFMQQHRGHERTLEAVITGPAELVTGTTLDMKITGESAIH